MAALNEGASLEQPQVFVSYSRRDALFVDRLDLALKVRGFSPLIDRAEIYAFEDWWVRIEALIVKADTIIFVLSPHAASSPICKKEVAFAASLQKRFAPIVCENVDPNHVPEQLSRLNFISFTDTMKFEDSADRLAVALLTDIWWIRKHTEIGALARRWALAGRPGPVGLLLRPPLLEDAERWVAARPQNAPHATEECRQYIAESRRATTARRNMLTASLGAGFVVALILAVIALWQRSIALTNESLAQTQTVLAQTRAEEADQQRQAARRALAVAHTKESLFLARASREELRNGNPLLAEQIALRGLPTEYERPLVPETFGAFVESFNEQRLAQSLVDEEVQSKDANYAAFERRLSFSPDGAFVAATSYNNLIKIWSTSTNKTAYIINGDKKCFLNFVAIGRNGRVLTACSGDSDLRLREMISGRQLAVLYGHTKPIVSLRAVQDGQFFLTTSEDKTVRVWDAMTGASVGVYRGSPEVPVDAIIDATGRRIVARFGDRFVGSRGITAALWDVQSKDYPRLLKGHRQAINSVAFSPDGRTVLTASDDKTARLWDSTTGQIFNSLEGHSEAVVTAVFSADGAQILTASHDKTAKLWDVASSRAVATFTGHREPLFGAAFVSSRQGIVVTAAEDETLRVWNAATSSEMENMSNRIFELQSLLLSPTGDFILTLSRDQKLRLWPTLAKDKSVVLIGHEGTINSVNFAHSGKLVVTASKDTTARLWEMKSGRELLALRGHEGSVETAVFSPNEQLVLTASVDGTARIWRVTDGAEIKSFKQIGSSPLAATWSGDGARILVVDQTSAVLWDVADQRILAKFGSEEFRFKVACFNKEGTRILTDNSAIVSLWDGRNGHLIKQLHSKAEYESRHLAMFSLKGDEVLTTIDSKLTLWNSNNGVRLSSVDLGSNVTAAALASDGKRIVFVTEKRPAFVWNISLSRKVTSIFYNDTDIEDASFGPDGARIATSSHDGTSRVWESSTGREIFVLRGKENQIKTTVGITSNNERIAFVTDDNRVNILWIGANSKELIASARKTLPEPMTADNEKKYFLAVDTPSNLKH